MVDACYLCRRTQADLDRLNEELRTRVYLSYFGNARDQIDEQQRRISFLQRLKDEESGDAHFRIGAQQVFGDPAAYQKLMPWIDRLIEITNSGGPSGAVTGSIGQVVEKLLAEQRALAARMEDGLNHIRGGFVSGGRSPLFLHPVTCSFPVEWAIEGYGFTWADTPGSGRELLRKGPGEPKQTVDVPLFLCSVCQKLAHGP